MTTSTREREGAAQDVLAREPDRGRGRQGRGGLAVGQSPGQNFGRLGRTNAVGESGAGRRRALPKQPRPMRRGGDQIKCHDCRQAQSWLWMPARAAGRCGDRRPGVNLAEHPRRSQSRNQPGGGGRRRGSEHSSRSALLARWRESGGRGAGAVRTAARAPHPRETASTSTDAGLDRRPVRRVDEHGALRLRLRTVRHVITPAKCS